MSEGKTSISQARTYEEIGEFWDTHDITDFSDELEHVDSPPATSVVHIVSFELDIDTLSGLIELGKQRGVEPLSLAAEWLAERVAAERER